MPPVLDRRVLDGLMKEDIKRILREHGVPHSQTLAARTKLELVEVGRAHGIYDWASATAGAGGARGRDDELGLVERLKAQQLAERKSRLKLSAIPRVIDEPAGGGALTTKRSKSERRHRRSARTTADTSPTPAARASARAKPAGSGSAEPQTGAEAHTVVITYEAPPSASPAKAATSARPASSPTSPIRKRRNTESAAAESVATGDAALPSSSAFGGFSAMFGFSGTTASTPAPKATAPPAPAPKRSPTQLMPHLGEQPFVATTSNSHGDVFAKQSKHGVISPPPSNSSAATGPGTFTTKQHARVMDRGAERGAWGTSSAGENAQSAAVPLTAVDKGSAETATALNHVAPDGPSLDSLREALVAGRNRPAASRNSSEPAWLWEN